MTKLSALAILAILACSASAHTIFQKLYVNGVDQGHLVGIRAPNYDGPLTDITSDDIICNGGIHPYHQPVSQAVIDVPAGATVTAEWHHFLNQTAGDPLDPINPTHKGPIIAYLAKVDDATQTDVTELEWFKIYEDGLTVSTVAGGNGTGTAAVQQQQWAADRLIANAGKVSFTIPECIASGHYLLRHEIIALYHASKYPGAEFYVECAQLNIVGGSGDEDPSETVSFPGAYNASDPGITLNIYDPNLTNYTIPGPALFSC